MSHSSPRVVPLAEHEFGSQGISVLVRLEGSIYEAVKVLDTDILDNVQVPDDHHRCGESIESNDSFVRVLVVLLVQELKYVLFQRKKLQKNETFCSFTSFT